MASSGLGGALHRDRNTLDIISLVLYESLRTALFRWWACSGRHASLSLYIASLDSFLNPQTYTHASSEPDRSPHWLRLRKVPTLRLVSAELAPRLHAPRLKNSGCWYKPDAKPSDLKTPVHPLFKKDRWEKKGTLDIGDGTKGKWEYRNEVVREALMPSLRLASLLLANSALWPWYVCSFVASLE